MEENVKACPDCGVMPGYSHYKVCVSSGTWMGPKDDNEEES